MHNTRSERLWYDVTNGFGRKWKEFFIDLEVQCGLQVGLPAHKWLLSHLFLERIDYDAQQWAEGWNLHRLELSRTRDRSPYDMFMFGMLQNGARGVVRVQEPIHEEVENVQEYGIDWETYEDDNLMEHFEANNVDIFSPVSAPRNLSNVPCEPSTGPLTEEQVDALDQHLSNQFNTHTLNMLIHRQVWLAALHRCQEWHESFIH